MSLERHYESLLTLAAMEYPGAKFDFLGGAVFSQSLTAEDHRHYIRLLEFARSRQSENPIYETVYHQLLHLYVLNGSRLNVLRGIDRRIQGLIAEQGSLILISGVSGIGKTSLVMAFRERIHQVGARLIMARCWQQGLTSYALWRDVARAVAAATGASLDEILAPIGNGSDAQSAQHLVHALSDWLDKSAAVQPLVILLDDLHWADTDSLEVLNFLTNRDTTSPILFVGTYRSEETIPEYPLFGYLREFQRNGQSHLISLDLLTPADIERLVTAYHGACSPQLAGYLHARSQGLPLFVVELLRDLVEQDLLPQDGAGYWLPPHEAVPVPKFLKPLITQRVSRLGRQVERLLSVAAVAGETWSLRIVEELTGMSEEEALLALERALLADVIAVEDDKAEIYRFSHGLIREVLYVQQMARRRKRLHEQIALLLEKQQSSIYTLAHHFYEAENWEKACQYCLEAGEHAARSFASNRAIDLYQKALDALQRSTRDTNPRLHMDIYERLGRLHRVLDQQLEAENAFSRMRDVAHGMGDLNAEGYALTQLVHVRIAQYRLDPGEQTAREALKIAEQLGDPRLLAQIHGSLGKLLLIRGHLDASTHHLNQYRYRSDVLNDSETQSDTFRQQAYLAIWAGRYEEAEAFAQQSLDHGLKSGNLLHISGGYQVLSFSQIEAGKYAEAYQGIRLILDQTELNDPYHHQLTRLLNQMGYLFLELGDAAQALTWDQRALESSQHVKGVSRFEMQRYSLLNTSTDLLYLGRLDEALDYVARFEAMKDAPDYGHFRYQNRHLLLMSELCLAQRQLAQAITFAQKARIFAQEFGATKNIAKSHWFEGQALFESNQRPSAVRHLQEAVKIADEMQHGSLRWKVRFGLAKALTSVGESPEGIIQEARALIRQISPSLAGSPLRGVFQEAHWLAQLEGLAQQASPEDPAYPAGLTRREVEVLRLVASGATNQQIADALTISPRTVNTHITNILNKTGCENRTAASAFAVRHNLLST